ncbi:MAG TPA: glycosyltransferase family 4 protein [Gemmatimonadaceae bacterium]
MRAPRQRVPSRALQLLHVGDQRPVKDQRVLLTAVNRMVAAGVDVQLDMVGLDTMGGELQRAFASEPVGRVTRWHGVLGREPLRALMDAADLLVLPSRHEAGAIVVLEAAIAGIPTVGTAVGDLAEWSPEAAVAVPVGDAESLARELSAIAIDEPRRLALAHEAQRRAVAIDADYTAASFERIYDEIGFRA